MPRKRSAEEAELVNDFVPLYGPFLPRIAARMLAVLVLDGGELTSQDLVERLTVSAASVSSMSKRLMKLGLVMRRIDPDTRRDLFSIRSDAWSHSWIDSRELNLRIVDWASRAIALGGGDKAENESLIELRNFSSFIAEEMPTLLQRYREQHQPPAEPE